MPDRKAPCPFGDKPHAIGARHTHDYPIGQFGVRRCTCGNRTFHLLIGGPLPTAVTCVKCGRANYAATAYERGREDGPRARSTSGEPPF